LVCEFDLPELVEVAEPVDVTEGVLEVSTFI